MLLELRVENLLLIERAELRLGAGLTVITGETGAGKTVLAHALDLLLGGRPRPGIVRPGAEEAYVEGVFEASEGLLSDGLAPEGADLRELIGGADGDLPEGEEIVLARRVSAVGRTRAFVQGRSATARDLRELGSRLLAFYGQHEHRKLTVASSQLELLDGFCGPDHLAARRELAVSYQQVRDRRRALEGLRERAGSRDRDLDLLAFEIEEIERAVPSAEEEAALLAERERLRRTDALRAAAAAGVEAIVPEADGPGAATTLAEAERLAESVTGVDPALDALAERLTALRLEAEDLGSELRSYALGLDGEPGRLEQVEERLELYDRLERKHGGSVEAVLAHAERCRAERERLVNAEVELERAETELAGAEADLRRRADALAAARGRAAPRLAKRVRDELRELAMEAAAFSVDLRPRADGAADDRPEADRHDGPHIGPTGAERVELMIAPNPGVAAAPLRDAASGGELSRVMLALMSVASAEGPGTLVFDEVDAGVGGQTARAVGERLRTLGRERQVVCITHLPQIASLAEHHFRIEKEPSPAAAPARATVEQLDEAEVVAELCRMLGADASDDGARRHAQELLAAA
jgi:DNA repair protein RecN (Recombination protein N)